MTEWFCNFQKYHVMFLTCILVLSDYPPPLELGVNSSVLVTPGVDGMSVHQYLIRL